MRGAAVAVNRGAGASLPRATRPLLLEGLSPAAGDLRARLGLVRAAAAAGEISLDGFPDQVAAERVLEDGRGEVDFADPLLLPVDDGQFRHGSYSGFANVERTILTSERRAPGTGPRR